MKPANNSIQQKLYQVIDESLALLKQSSISEQKPVALDVPIPSLLEQCLELCEQHQEQSQEPLRTIHHFGLPLDSPLLSSLATIANTRVLTDIHPNNNCFIDSIKSQTLVAKSINANKQTESISEDDEYRIKIFLNDLQQMQQQCNQIGQRLLICDNHCLYQTDKSGATDLLTLLNRQFTVSSLIVVTDPVDSYPVYCANAQTDTPPLSFEEYCQSILGFIQTHSHLKVIRHEDFVAETKRVMVGICEVLELPGCDEFLMLEDVYCNEDKYLTKKFKNSFSSAKYWEQRYCSGGTSGYGSYGHLSEFKSKIINDFLKNEDIKSLIEFGCGDGNQLSQFIVDNYIGIDISSFIIKKCRKTFQDDSSKQFYTNEEFLFKKIKSPLTISLDVLFHLIEDKIFEQYMFLLFESSSQFCIIYSCDEEQHANDAIHVKRRLFTEWIKINLPSWHLIHIIYNKYPDDGTRNSKTTSFSNFYIFQVQS